MLAAYTGLQVVPTPALGVSCVPDPYYNGPTNDPYWQNVSLLMHFDGTTFVDSSSYGHTFSATAGSPAISTAQAKFGGASGAFLGGGGTNQSGISSAYDARFSFGSGAFTIEFWIYPVSTNTFGRAILAHNTPGFYEWQIVIDSSGSLTMVGTDGASQFFNLGTGVIPNGQWTHIALAWQGTGGIAYVFVNGVLYSQGGLSGTFNAATGGALYIGYNPNLVSGTDMYLDELRITKGVCRYDGTFSPQIAAYPNALETNLPATLLNYPGGGSVTITNPTPFSIRFVKPLYGTDATKVAWLNTSSLVGKRYIEFVNQGPGDAFSNVGRGIFIGFVPAAGTPAANALNDPGTCLITNSNYSGVNPGYSVNGGGVISDAAYDFLQNDVIGMAIDHATNKIWVRKNGGAWIGGGNPATNTSPTFTVSAGTLRPYLLCIGQTFAFDAQVRMLLAADTFNAAAPAGFTGYEGLWAMQQTVLSLHGDGSFADSSVQNNVPTLFGGATTATSQKKFGSAALDFTTAGACVSYPDSTAFSIGTKSFTFECWVYIPTVTGSAHQLLLNGDGIYNANDTGLYIVIDSTGQLAASAGVNGNTSPSLGAGGTVPAGAWTHIALARDTSANLVRGFINGALVFAQTFAGTDSINNTSQALVIGYNPARFTNSLAGYMDEVRYTIGVARYTAAFTPATMANCDYAGGSLPPIPAPAPPPIPQPPLPTSITFNAVTLAAVTGTVSTAISSTTISTVTCADAAMTINVISAVPGLTFTYASNVLTVAGTPTTSGFYRVVVQYLASDGSYSVRGGTTHSFLIKDTAAVLTISSMANPVIKQTAVPCPKGVVDPAGFTTTLCTLTSSVPTTVHLGGTGYSYIPSINYGTSGSSPVSFTALLSFSFHLDWAPGATSGTLTMYGSYPVPGYYSDSTGFATSFFDPGTRTAYAITLNYYGPAGELLGTSTHNVTVVLTYQATPGTPSPSPAPSPVSPTFPPGPSPSPSPAPSPHSNSDYLFSGVLVLMHFDGATGLLTDVKGNSIQASTGGAAPTLTTGLVAEGAQFVTTTTAVSSTLATELSCDFIALRGPAGFGGLNTYNLSAECFVLPDAACWAKLTEDGSDARYCALVSAALDYAGPLFYYGYAWSLGLVSALENVGGRLIRQVRVASYFQRAFGLLPPSVALSPPIPAYLAAPQVFQHIAMSRVQVTTTYTHAAWLNGRAGSSATADIANLTPYGSVLYVGGTRHSVPFADGSSWAVSAVPFTGAMDELRITIGGRYSAYVSAVPTDIPAAERVVPWPDS